MTPQCNEPRRVRTNRERTMKMKTLSLRAGVSTVLMTAALLLLPLARNSRGVPRQSALPAHRGAPAVCQLCGHQATVLRRNAPAQRAYSSTRSSSIRATPRRMPTGTRRASVGLPPWADTGAESPPPDAPTLATEHPYCMPGEHCQFMATRTVQFPEGRALDFAAITDHSEQLGESNICEFEATQSCASDGDCNPVVTGKCFTTACAGPSATTASPASKRGMKSREFAWTARHLIAGRREHGREPDAGPPFCGTNGTICTHQARLVWDKIRADAEQAYDRSSACTFTTFAAYEYTAMAANGKCADTDGLPCWDQAQDNSVPDVPNAATPSLDCPSGAPCIKNFTGNSGGQPAPQRHLPQRRRDRSADQQRRDSSRLRLRQRGQPGARRRPTGRWHRPR